MHLITQPDPVLPNFHNQVILKMDIRSLRKVVWPLTRGRTTRRQRKRQTNWIISARPFAGLVLDVHGNGWEDLEAMVQARRLRLPLKVVSAVLNPQINANLHAGDVSALITAGLSGAQQSRRPTITKDEWLTRCAKRLTELGGLEPEVAHEVAETQFENVGEDLTESPEDAADEEMSYWSED